MSLRIRTPALLLGPIFAVGLMCAAAYAAATEAAAPAATKEATPAKEAAAAATSTVSPPWTDDFAAAKAQAKKEGKDILIFFTGSDWCNICNIQKKEVYDTEAFKAEASKKFALVEADLPEKKKLPEATDKQNRALAKEHNVGAMPVTMLLDSDGKAYARIDGYGRKGSPEEYLKYLEGFSAVRAEISKVTAEADKAKGVERAKLLDKLIGLWDKCRLQPKNWQALADEIQKLDEKDEAGLKSKYAKASVFNEIERLWGTQKYAEAIKVADKAITDLKLTGPDLQQALYRKGYSMWLAGDHEAGLKVMQTAIDAAPDTQWAGILKNMIRNLSALAPK